MGNSRNVRRKLKERYIAPGDTGYSPQFKEKKQKVMQAKKALKAARKAAAMEESAKAAMVEAAMVEAAKEEAAVKAATHKVQDMVNTWEQDMCSLGFLKPFPTWWPTLYLRLTGHDIGKHILGFNDPEI